MIGALVALMPAATAVLLAASLRLPSPVSTLLVAYLGFVVATVGIVLVLSPFREVHRGGLAAGEGVLLAVAFGVWWMRGGPVVSLTPARAATRALLRNAPATAFCAAIVGLLVYELVLGLTFPPNDWDSLTYHLPRAAAWAQHGGFYWVPDAPTDRINEFQPIAEQQILFFMAAFRSGALAWAPQYLATLAVLVAVYGAARRLGASTPAATCSSSLLATFTLFAAESTLSTNDVAATAFPIVAACLLLGSAPVESVLAGAAFGLGVATKLTTLLVLPVLLALAVLRGRRQFLLACVGAVAAFVSVGMWGFVLNLRHTGRLLGHGASMSEHTAAPGYPRSVADGIDLVYATLSATSISHLTVYVLAAVGVVLAAAAAIWMRGRSAYGAAADIALPFLLPLLGVAAAGALVAVNRLWGHQIPGPGAEDFGPVGGVAAFVTSAAVGIQYARGRLDRRHLALAAAVPLFVVLLVLYATYNPDIGRFLLVPYALCAPLFWLFFRNTRATASLALVACVVAAITIVPLWWRPIHSAQGWSWQLGQSGALAVHHNGDFGEALDTYLAKVPPHSFVGVVAGANDPVYLLYGRRLDRRIEFVPATGAVRRVGKEGLRYVVLTTPDSRVSKGLRREGWVLDELPAGWTLATR